MPTTVGRWELRVPVGGDAPQVPLWLTNLATDLSNVAMDDQGSLAARPVSAALDPSNKPGGYWYVTGDTDAGQNDRLWRDTGSGWVEVATLTRRASATWDPPTIAAGDYAYTTITVSGARPGDFCLASFTPYPGAHVVASAQVNTDDEVVATLHNARLSGSADLGSGTLRVLVLRGG